MRKVLVFLLTLGFAASAFALDLGNGLTVTGEVKAGLSVNSGDDGKDATDDNTAKAWNQDAERAYRIRTTFGYAGDWGGAKIRLQADGNAEIITVPAAANPEVYRPDIFTQFAYGWADFLEKKVVVYGGLAMEDLWGLGKLSANVFD
ncbi:MAG: hypothetical protein LBL31_07045, partial [Spirochaetaceae bacterium]|nr:hypothetical protein [Spirochaetaceae bacterium]